MRASRMCGARCTICRRNSPRTTASPPTSRPWATSWGISGRAVRFLIRKSICWCGSPQRTRACRPDRADRARRPAREATMKLSLKRSQTRTLVLRRPVFKLWARFDLTSDEQRLMQRYPMDDAILTDEENDERVRTWANRTGLAVTVIPVVWILTAQFGYVSFLYNWYTNAVPDFNFTQ